MSDRYNASVLLDANLEAGRGAKIAVQCDDERLTYGELFDRVCRWGWALTALGVRREERVLMVMDDTPAFPTVFLGTIRIGAVPIPVNPLYRVEDYRFFVADSYARVVVTDAVFFEKVSQALVGYPEPVQIVVAGQGVPTRPAATAGAARAETRSAPTGRSPVGDQSRSSPRAQVLDDLLEEHPGELPPAATHRDDMAFWLYSSGSTGNPKGVVHLQHDIPYTCETYARHVLAIREGDVTYSTGKLFHAYGLGNNLTFPYWAGATTVVAPGRPTPERVFTTIARFRPTLFFSVPTLVNALVNHPDAHRYDLASIRLDVSAAEPLPPPTFHRWRDLCGRPILDGVGSTEMLHIYCSNTPADVRPGSSGRPVPGYELKILDDDGRPVPPGTVGDMYVKGDSGAPFYWHQHERSQRCMQGGWFYSGDRYRVDDEGFYWYEGRSDDMIRVSGEWVSPIEVENTLLEHEAVLEAAVVGVDVDGFTRIKAFVMLKDGMVVTAALSVELQEWCKGRLRRFQYPHLVEFVDELPKTLTGKIQRYKLRERG